MDYSEFMPSSERGLFVLQSEGVSLDYDEYLAIRLNDGAGPAENKPYNWHTPPLSLLIHWADHWRSVQEKEADR